MNGLNTCLWHYFRDVFPQKRLEKLGQSSLGIFQDLVERRNIFRQIGSKQLLLHFILFDRLLHFLHNRLILLPVGSPDIFIAGLSYQTNLLTIIGRAHFGD